MKKFCNLMLYALVVFGAIACNGDFTDIFGKQNDSTTEGFSFIAEIESTRADVVNDNGSWKTVWSGDDKLYVTSDKGNFTFANTPKELNRFSCSDANASVLADATNVVITTQHENNSVVDSDAGRRGLSLRKEYDRFPESGKVGLAIQSAFLRYSSDYAVTLSASSAIFSGIDGSSTLTASITLDAGEDIWVAFAVRAESIDLTASIAGTMELSIEGQAIEPGRIYNLGEIVPEVAPEPKPEEDVIYLVPNDNWKSADAWFAAYFFNEAGGNTAVALSDEDADGAYECVVPADMEMVIFCRMNPAYTEFAWNDDTVTDRVWTQTADLTIGVAPNNYYYVIGWDSGEWNVQGYTPEPPAIQQSWAVAGSFNEWSDIPMSATDVANIFVAQGVELKSKEQFKIKAAGSWDKNFGGGVNNLMPNMWMKGYQDGSDIVVAKSGTYDIYLEYADGDEYGKIYLIETGGDYTVATEQTTDGTLVPDGSEPGDTTSEYKIYVYQYNNSWTAVNLYSWDALGTEHTGSWPGSPSTAVETINGYNYLVWTMPLAASNQQLNVILNDGTAQTSDFALGMLDRDYYLLLDGNSISIIEDKENPEPEVVQGEPQPSTWALAGDFNTWGDEVMYTTDVAELFVAKSVTIGAYKEIKVKEVGNWNNNYGVDGVNYLNANVWTKVKSGGGNLSIVNAGVYDIYFDNANKRIYLMNEGADYATATEQNQNGVAPDLSDASWGLCGTHNSWSSPDIQLVWDGTISLYVAYSAKLTGEFKVRANNSWGEDYGSGSTITVDDANGTAMTKGGGNCKVTSGTYDVYFDLSSKKIWVRTPGSDAPTK